MWRTISKANRPWPVLDDDPVIDYMIMEAVAVKVSREDAERVKQEERNQWKRAKSPALESMK
jgi:hypothetical protein